MVDEFDRYAVYWVPERSDALARFGCSWSGWCPDQGEHRRREGLASFPFDVTRLTARLWRHGFHGVIKAPFALAGSGDRWVVEREVEELAEELAPFTMPGLQVAVVDGRVALVPETSCPSLPALVGRVERALAAVADVAAPMASRPAAVAAAASERGRIIQLPAPALYRFHVPLTDRLEVDEAFAVARALDPVLRPLLARTRRLRDLALMGDPGDGRPLRVLRRYELCGAGLRGIASALPTHGPQMLAPGLNDRALEADIAI